MEKILIVIFICGLFGCDHVHTGEKAIAIIENAFQVKLPKNVYAQVEITTAITMVIHGKCNLSPQEFDKFIYTCKYIPSKSQKIRRSYSHVVDLDSSIMCYWQNNNDIVTCNIGYGKTNHKNNMFVFTLTYENIKQTGRRVKHWTNPQWEH